MNVKSRIGRSTVPLEGSNGASGLPDRPDAVGLNKKMNGEET